jgi:hypothetical protein
MDHEWLLKEKEKFEFPKGQARDLNPDSLELIMSSMEKLANEKVCLGF